MFRGGLAFVIVVVVHPSGLFNRWGLAVGGSIPTSCVGGAPTTTLTHHHQDHAIIIGFKSRPKIDRRLLHDW